MHNVIASCRDYPVPYWMKAMTQTLPVATCLHTINLINQSTLCTQCDQALLRLSSSNRLEEQEVLQEEDVLSAYYYALLCFIFTYYYIIITILHDQYYYIMTLY